MFSFIIVHALYSKRSNMSFSILCFPSPVFVCYLSYLILNAPIVKDNNFVHVILGVLCSPTFTAKHLLTIVG